MRAKKVNENIGGIPWSGTDPTKAHIIGVLTTKPMDARMKFPAQDYNVVEIIETDYGTLYIVDSWYKPGVPQIIHEDMVEKYIPFGDVDDDLPF